MCNHQIPYNYYTQKLFMVSAGEFDVSPELMKYLGFSWQFQRISFLPIQLFNIRTRKLFITSLL